MQRAFWWGMNRRTSIETPTGTYRLASQSLYGLAVLVDISIPVLFSGVIVAAISSLLTLSTSYDYWQFMVGSLFLVYAMAVFYFQAVLAWFGATLAQFALGLRVITIRGESPDFWTVVWHYKKNNICLILVGIFSVLPLGSSDVSFRSNISGFLIVLYMVAPLLLVVEARDSLSGFERQSEHDQRNTMIVIQNNKFRRLPVTPDNYQPASIVARSIASMLDLTCLVAVTVLVCIIGKIIWENSIGTVSDSYATYYGYTNNNSTAVERFTTALFWPVIGYLIISLLIFYLTTLLAWGNTPGKFAMGIRIIKTNGRALDGKDLKQSCGITFTYIIVSLAAVMGPNDYYYPVRDMFQSYFNVTLEWFEIPLVAFVLLQLFDASLALVTKKHQSLRELLTDTQLVKVDVKPSYYESKSL